MLNLKSLSNMLSVGNVFAGEEQGEEWLITTTLTNPAGGAINTAMVDSYSAVIITTTTYWVDQTIGTPTNTSATKRFSVINNDTSTHWIRINTQFIYPWMTKYFVWDGTSWTWNDWDVEWKSIFTPETSTRFYCPYILNSNITTTTALTTNILYCIPYRTIEELIIDTMTSVWTAGGTGGTWVLMWIYESNVNWLPTTLLTTSTQIATTAASWTATYTLATDLVIPANKTIWFAFAVNTWTTWRTQFGAYITNMLWIELAWTTFNSHIRASLTPWFTTLPSPAPAAWSFTKSTFSLPSITLGLINQW